MPNNISMSIDDMELTCLEIMARGEDLLPLGVWESPIKRLAMKELAVPVGRGYRITESGRAVFAQAEGMDLDQVTAMAPQMPTWIVNTLPGEPEAIVILHRNDLAVSGYEAAKPVQFVPIVHNRNYDFGETAFRGDVDGFLQAMLDTAWKRGLRPTDAGS